jgi:hypothetical protein
LDPELLQLFFHKVSHCIKSVSFILDQTVDINLSSTNLNHWFRSNSSDWLLRPIVTEFLVKPANRVPIRPYRFAILFRIGTRKFVHNSLVTAYQHMRSSPEEICLLHMKDEGSRQNRKKTYKETQKKLWERRGQNRTEKKLEEFVASAKRNRSDKALFAIEDEFNSS